MTMHPPQLMSPHLQPSPFSPTQFLTPTSEECTFIKKKPLELTEDLVEGRVETASQRLRRHATRRATLRGCDIRRLCAPVVDPTTPPNPPPNPPPTPPSQRRSPKNRRSTKVKRACTTASSKKSTRESSPALLRSRSPLGLWTPPPPPPRFSPSYAFGPQSHVWTNNIPWTITSPSSSPYPSHSPPPHHQA